MSLKIIINCGPCEEFISHCLQSVQSQTIVDWQAFVTIDECKKTYGLARQKAGEDERIHIKLNPIRQYSLKNQIDSIKESGSDPLDIIVSLDGDDWFANKNALQIISSTYMRKDCWITYGSWFSQKPIDGLNDYGSWPAYEPGTKNFREHRWLATAVRTWKRWIWNRIEDIDLRDNTGEYFRIAEDRAIMLPLLEMCGTKRAQHIPDLLMEYNFLNYNSTENEAEAVRNVELLKHRTRYRKLTMGVI